MKQNQHTEEEAKEWHRYYLQEGKTYDDVTIKYHVAKRTVVKYFALYKLPHRVQGTYIRPIDTEKEEQQRQEARGYLQRFKQGESFVQIAKTAGKNKVTVSKLVNKFFPSERRRRFADTTLRLSQLGLTAKEIAEQQGITSGAVSARLYRERKRIQNKGN